jgi:hypothetical protein
MYAYSTVSFAKVYDDSIWSVAANILNKQSQPTRGGPPAWGLGELLTTPHLKKLVMLRNITRSR